MLEEKARQSRRSRQPLDRVKHTCPVSAAVGVDRRRSEDPTEATGVLLCNGDYFKMAW